SQKKFHHLFRMYGGILLFLTLLVNFLLFVQFSSKNQKLKAQSSTAVLAKQKLDYLSNVYKEKKIFVDSLNVKSASLIAYYADRLAIDLPVAIKWEVLTINPSKRQSPNKNGFDFDQNKIFIKGVCPNPVVLEEWIKVIKTYNWVVEIADQRYFYNDEKHLGRFEFFIETQDDL
ncbi:MAG: hypothetical protein LW832_00640, partial [Parachlamydia sp.]|nr:hypothetical protein [Parachlamydia sp.]